MPDSTKINGRLSKLEKLERELNLKQLQINRLLNITQAINNNVSAEGLFNMYRSFLGWEVGIKKMVLFIKKDGRWISATSLGIDDALFTDDIPSHFSKFESINNIDESDHPFFQEFDVVIPVMHKDLAIAYVFIGGFGEDDDIYNKIQFITTITNVIAVAIENKRLFRRQLEQERLKKEMELAGEMQKMLVPQSLPSKDCYELSSIYKPQMGVGGDYFDFIEFDDGKIVFCIGDISGKGIAAALLMANFQANFSTLINQRTDLEAFIRALNLSVNRITKGERFITFFIAQYDIQTRELRYINAGHNPPVLVTNDEVILLNKGCTILGSFVELPEVEVGSLFLENEAIILAFTDGLTDLHNAEGEFLNEQMLYNFVRDHYQMSASAFNEKLVDRLGIFIGDEVYPDDFTVLTCKIFLPPSPC